MKELTMTVFSRCSYAPAHPHRFSSSCRQASRWAAVRLLALCVLALAHSVRAERTGSGAERPPDAKELSEAYGLRGGLAVASGDLDISWVRDLAESGSCLVLVLVEDAPAAEALRGGFVESGHSGYVTVASWDGRRIPLADHAANLIAGVGADPAERLRVLVPVRGQDLTMVDGAWKSRTKPMPDGMDGWGHFFHNAAGTKVSRDTAIEIPNSLRWVAGPRLNSLANGNGWRVQDGIAVSETEHQPMGWGGAGHKRVLAEGRDAFNGTLHWMRTMQTRRVFKTKPLILEDGRLLSWIDDGQTSRLAAYNAVSGELMRVYENSLQYRHSPHYADEPEFTYFDGKIIHSHRNVVRCLDAGTGEILWHQTHQSPDESVIGLVRPVIAADLGRVVFAEVGAMEIGRSGANFPSLRLALDGHARFPGFQAEGLVAMDLKTGERLWRTPVNADLRDWNRREPHTNTHQYRSIFKPDKRTFHSLAYRDGRMFAMNGIDANGGMVSVVWCVDARDGRDLWTEPVRPSDHPQAAARTRWERFDLFPLPDGTLFSYGHGWSRMDQATGKILAFGSNAGGNARCDAGAATANLILAGFGNFFNLSDEVAQWTRRDITRSVCGGAGTPAYGMQYFQGTGCGCYTMVRGNLALGRAPLPEPVPVEARRTNGPAYGNPLGEASAASDWPTYLYDGLRGAWAPRPGPQALVEHWRVQVASPITPDVEGIRQDWLHNGFYNGPVTAPVVANGVVVAADREGRSVRAYDAASGELRWTVHTGARVLTPPTLSRGRAVFGTRDGYVHCHDLATGVLAWKFLAAPERRYLMSYGQIESVWPLHGSLPVVDGMVVATAGYHGELDGGIWAWGLDLATGDVRWSHQLYRPERDWQDLGEDVQDMPQPFSIRKTTSSRYYFTIPRNIDLPKFVSGWVTAARVSFHPATGEIGGGHLPDGAPMLSWGDRFLFTESAFEYKDGPFGQGRRELRFAGEEPRRHRDRIRVEYTSRIITDGKRVAISRTFHNGAPARLELVDTRNRGKQKKDRIIAEIPSDGPRCISLITSLVGAGDILYSAGRTGSQKERKGVQTAGRLGAVRLDGTELAEIRNLEWPVIENGLAVADGRLYAMFEDGTLRCYGE